MRTEDRTTLDQLMTRSALLLTRIRTTIPAGMPAPHNQHPENPMHWILALTLATQVAMPPAVAPLADSQPAPLFATRIGDTDPADSLLRAASEKMSRGDYRGAAATYRSAARAFPNSMRISEAMYFEAFALYRAGDLAQSRSALDALRARYPQAAARGDANSLRARVCGELARQGDSACAEEVTRVSASAATRSARRGSSDCPDGDDDDDTRIAALNALLQMDASRAMPILTSVLARRDACSERLRRKAVFLVAQKQTRESADVLLTAAKNDPDNEVREQAVFWLSQVKDPRAVEMLTGIITSNGTSALRERALFALSQRRGAGNDAFLLAVAADAKEPEELRKRAIFLASQMGISIAKDESRDRGTRKNAVFWLGQSGDPRAVSYFEDVLTKH